MKYREEEFKQKVTELYNGEVEIVGRFKGLTKPLLVQDKYGLMSVTNAFLVLDYKPGIKAALNKTEYFMNVLKEKHPEIALKLEPQSEYLTAKTGMLFKTKYGIVKSNPDALLAGHMPNIKSAIDRKDYFKNQLLDIYGNQYDFKITSTDRHHGRVILICPVHGDQSIDSDSIFLGTGCPMCNHGWGKSDTFYLVRLYNDEESFYKLGISHYVNNKILRFNNYRSLGYTIEELYIRTFETSELAKEFETRLKRIIKNNLYCPKKWGYSNSTECFDKDLLSIVLDNLEYDIVSSSTEMLSSPNLDGLKLTTSTED